jgi:hypothetical protein
MAVPPDCTTTSKQLAADGKKKTEKPEEKRDTRAKSPPTSKT